VENELEIADAIGNNIFALETFLSSLASRVGHGEEARICMEMQKVIEKTKVILDNIKTEKPACFGNVTAIAFERGDHGCDECKLHDRCCQLCENQL